MKLIRFGNPGEEKPGLQLEDGRRTRVLSINLSLDVRTLLLTLVDLLQLRLSFLQLLLKLLGLHLALLYLLLHML